MRFRFVVLAALALSSLVACNTGEPAATKDRAPEPSKPTEAPKPTKVEPKGVLRLGAPIEAANKEVALSEVAREPKKYASAPFVTTGTVSAVCQHMGCWMELKDDAGQAHIKMAGHAFFVPKTASGKKARVAGTVIAQETGDGCGEGHQGHGESGKKGCKAEAEAQLGRPLAKLELVATGVEILD